MAGGQGGDEWVARDHPVGEGGFVDRQPEHSGVMRPSRSPSTCSRVVMALASSTTSGLAVRNDPTSRRQRLKRRGLHESQPQQAKLASVRALRVAYQLIRSPDDLARSGQKELAGGAEGKPATDAGKQRHPDGAFERGDLAAQRRLRQVQPVRGMTDVQLLGDMMNERN